MSQTETADSFFTVYFHFFFQHLKGFYSVRDIYLNCDGFVLL